jgi:hypothetical protein
LPGGNAACGLPICCRTNQGPPLNPNAAAGYWGNGGCDIPMHHFENTLQQIKNTHKVKNLSFSIGWHGNVYLIKNGGQKEGPYINDKKKISSKRYVQVSGS